MSPPCELWLAVLHTAAPESARAPPGIVTIPTDMARASTAADSAFLMFIPIVTIDLPVVRFDGSRAISRVARPLALRPRLTTGLPFRLVRREHRCCPRSP